MNLEKETERSITPRLAQKAEDKIERSLSKAHYSQASATECHSKPADTLHPVSPPSRTSTSQITGELFQMHVKATACSFVLIFP